MSLNWCSFKSSKPHLVTLSVAHKVAQIWKHLNITPVCVVRNIPKRRRGLIANMKITAIFYFRNEWLFTSKQKEKLWILHSTKESKTLHVNTLAKNCRLLSMSWWFLLESYLVGNQTRQLSCALELSLPALRGARDLRQCKQCNRGRLELNRGSVVAWLGSPCSSLEDWACLAPKCLPVEMSAHQICEFVAPPDSVVCVRWSSSSAIHRHINISTHCIVCLWSCLFYGDVTVTV